MEFQQLWSPRIVWCNRRQHYLGRDRRISLPHRVRNSRRYSERGQNFAAQGHSFSEIGQLIGRNGQFNFQLDSSAQYGIYDFNQDAANFAVGVVSEGFFEGSNLGYLEMTVRGQAVGYGSSNWGPSQMAWWQGLWTAGWNAAQTGNYPVQVGSPLQLPVPLN